MDNMETSQGPQENEGAFQSPGSSNRSKRHSSFTKPFSGLRRMSSKLVPSSWGKNDMKYEALDSSTDLLDKTPKLPETPKKANESKESFLTSLDRLADYPNYQSNPAPGLGYKKPESATRSDNKPNPHIGKQPPVPSDNSPGLNISKQLPVPFDDSSGLNTTRESSTSFIPSRLNTTKENSASFIPRYSNAPILFPSLMAPIPPGGPLPQRGGMARSRTTGNLEPRKVAYKDTRSNQGSTANYMRPTSSSIARRTSTVPSPTSTVSPSTQRRPSAEHPLHVKTDRGASTQGPRLSSSNSSRALRAHVTSDLPFRELYGTKAPDEKNVVQTASRPARFMEDAYDALRDSKIPKAIPTTTTGSVRKTHQAAPTSIDTGTEFGGPYYPAHEIDWNEVKSPEFLITPKINTREAGKASAAPLDDYPGHTPLDLMEMKHTSFPAGGHDKAKLRQDAPDSPLSETETVRYDQGESSVKQGKQRERGGVDGGDSMATHNRRHETMGYYDEEGYTAPAKEQQSVESCEGDTIIHGGIGDTDTNSGRSKTMRANTMSPMFPEEEEDDDPRNVSEALSRFPCPYFLSLFDTSPLACSSKLL